MCLLLALPLGAAEYAVGVGAEADTADSFAISAFGSVALAEETWLSAIVAKNRSDGELFALEAVHVDTGIDHWFDPLGVRLGGGYWGDPDLLDSRDLRVAAYWKNDTASVSIDYERRAFELTIDAALLPAERRVDFDADGVGVSGRLRAGERVAVYASGMRYDYSRNLALRPDVDVLRVFALSRLSAINSLLDRRVSGGIEVDAGTRVLDVQVSSWRTAVFRDRVDSVGIGLLTPLGDASDIELRIARDDSDAFGHATVFSVFLYFYGR